MSAEKFLKITYRANDEKLNAYLKMPSPTLAVLKKEISIRLFNERQLPEVPIRVFWIDEDNDEIDLVSQYDYEIFLAQHPVRQHIHVTPVNEATSRKANATTGSGSSAVHIHVECDECKASPIVGFRYKCIECPNFDLCQKCESEHKHSGHMMMRMPNANCPTLGEVIVTAPFERRSKRHSKNRGPFTAQAGFEAPEQSTENAKEGGERQHHHGRRAYRKQMRQNLLSNIFAMMNENAAAQATAPTAPQNGNAAKAAEAAAKMAESAAKAAHEIASKVSATLVAGAQQTQNPDEGAAASASSEAAKEKSTGAKPKTPPSTPRDKPEIPVLNIPGLEQLAQYIDPQYLSTGMEILNNFAEGFAKMLDPADDGNFQCPFAPAEERKASSASTGSSSQASQTSEKHVETENLKETEKPKEAEKPKADDAEKKSEHENDAPINSGASASTSGAATPQQPQNERPRTQSIEENDWQLIDKQNSNASLASVEGATAAPVTTTDQPAQTSTASTPNTAMNFEQLGKDLKAHIEAEKKREEQQAPLQPQQPKAPEERRSIPIYHTNERVNMAIHSMMAMGFSNEGAWLTQLLESVNGNIPEALDLLSAAQRNNK